jgi:membrane-bound metal-dependent hydrolase YbcI (DUF457 family)
VEGYTHGLSGFAAGLAVAPHIDGLAAAGPGAVVVFAAVTTGAAYIPDLDHQGAKASRLLGPITGLLSWLLRKISGLLYRATKGPRDERCRGEHRHFWHTAIAAAALGLLTAWFTSIGGPWAVAAVVLFLLLLAENSLGDWAFLLFAGGIAVWLAAVEDPVQLLDSAAGWIGCAVFLGCLIHDLGDMLTHSGVPLLWPMPIRGETWYELRPPRFLRFTTGTWPEFVVVTPVLALAILWLFPGTQEHLVPYLLQLDAQSQ